MPDPTPTPGILCCWSALPPKSHSWFENTYIPRMRASEGPSTIAHHCLVTSTGMEQEPTEKSDIEFPYMTWYNIDNMDGVGARLADPRCWPGEEMFDKGGVLEGAKFDIRTYKEVMSWAGEEWDGDSTQITSLAIMEWAIPSNIESEVLAYYTSWVGPTLASSPDTMRVRFMRVQDAVVQTGTKTFDQDKAAVHTYLSVVELAGDEWPWDVVIEMAADEGWAKYFESGEVAKWQLSHYLVNKTYTKEHPQGMDVERSE